MNTVGAASGREQHVSTRRHCEEQSDEAISIMEKKEYYINKISNSALTVFQKKVLKTIIDIPKGQVRSYAWVAKKAGSPKAARAVGNALAANPDAPQVPCHRVIASDGSIGGYSGSGGVAEKRRLLIKEGVSFRKDGASLLNYELRTMN